MIFFRCKVRMAIHFLPVSTIPVMRSECEGEAVVWRYLRKGFKRKDISIYILPPPLLLLIFDTSSKDI